MVEFLAARSGGDARSSLNALELALDTAERTGEDVTLADAEDAMQRKALRYDKSGDQHYDYISAWIKSTRGSDPDASLYYLAAMLEGGEDARFIARRMVILASEDVGNADPQALQVAVAAAHAVEHVGLPEATFALAQAAIYLSLAPKSNAAGKALGAARAHIREAGAAAPPAGAALGGLPGGAGARPRASATSTRTTIRAASTTRSTCPPAARTSGSTSPARPSRRSASGSQRSAPRGAVTSDGTRWGRAMRRGEAGVGRGGDVMTAPLEVRAPATGALLGTVAPVDLEAAAAAARTAQPLWSLVPASSRARYLRRAAVAMLDELDDLATRLAEETGRPRTQLVQAELLPAVRGLDALANDGPRALADRRVSPRAALLAGRSTRLVQSPVGVIGLAGPSASPWAEPALEAAAALLAGNGVLLTAGAPLAAQRLRGVFLRAGLPGELITSAPAGDLEAVCRRVVELPPPARLGTLVVLEGAPRQPVVDAAVWAAFGAHAAAAGRLVVVEGAVPGLLEALAQRAATLRVGDPLDEDTDVGPLADGRLVAPAVLAVERRRSPLHRPAARADARRGRGAGRRHRRARRRARGRRRADLGLGARSGEGRAGRAAAAVDDHLGRPPRARADERAGPARPPHRGAPARVARRVGAGHAHAARRSVPRRHRHLAGRGPARTRVAALAGAARAGPAQAVSRRRSAGLTGTHPSRARSLAESRRRRRATSQGRRGRRRPSQSSQAVAGRSGGNAVRVDPMSPDVVVIGAGVVGAACAYHLAAKGVHVRLLERGHVASGSSGACEGNVLAWDKELERELPLALRSAALWATLAAGARRRLRVRPQGQRRGRRDAGGAGRRRRALANPRRTRRRRRGARRRRAAPRGAARGA